jgi:hypothetical protein
MDVCGPETIGRVFVNQLNLQQGVVTLKWIIDPAAKNILEAQVCGSIAISVLAKEMIHCS